jgi:hypothetical protein
MRSPEYPLIEKGADHRVNGDGPIVKAVSVMVARSIHAQRFVSAGDSDRDAAERQAWRRNFAKARPSGPNRSGDRQRAGASSAHSGMNGRRLRTWLARG